jgi:rod shape determining protein RodA
MNDTRFWQRFDYILFGATLLLIAFGVMVIASATQDAVDPDLINRVPDQIRFAIFGTVALLGVAAIDYRMLGGLHRWLYATMVILLVAVVLVGTEGDAGAQRWLNVGILIQPSEICKLFIIITLAQFYATNYQKMDDIRTVIKSMLHLGVIAGLVFVQPDLGTTIVFVVIWAVVTWAAGLRMKHIALFGALGVLLMPVAITNLEPYQLDRITNFLFPQDDLEAQFGSQYNIQQALVSIGSGGVMGKGYTAGSQNSGRFLRVRHTDFIFSVIAHEFGLVGSFGTMALLMVVIMRILRGARYAADPLGSMICYGVAGMIFFQTLVSIGMNLNLMPVTGLTLPFVSSGGTSLLFTMLGVGLAESVIVRRRRLEL